MTLDPITLEVYRHRLQTIAEEMQNTLLKSAYSIMLKESGDCSCAVFSAAGETIAQAVSNPLHLASFLPAAAAVLARFPAASMREGDVFVLNDPYEGGTHIPDVIVIVPVFAEGRVVALGCSLGHHQDMGGMAPGSMPANATELYQEGFIIPPSRLYAAGEINETLIALLTRNVRTPDEVYGDLMAQVAAGKTAALRIQALIARNGLAEFAAVVPALLDHAEALTRAELRSTGGTGATWHGDGVDHLTCDIGNGRNMPAEPAEMDFPVRIWAHRLRIDSGGAGRFRGGLGVVREIELLEGAVTVSQRSDRHYTQPWGLHGGGAGARWIAKVLRRDRELSVIPGRLIYRLEWGERVIGLTGGGYGSPLERVPEAVRADVLDRKVSRQAAQAVYGVVLDDAGAVNATATATRRAALAKGRAVSTIERGRIGLGLQDA
jgi:N-methylhydantoinase B/oxoprolinase/acetone carboxylase alpha subunit